MAPSYQMPGWMQRSLGMGAQEVPFSPMVGLPTQQSRTPNRDLLMARALASGGNTDPGNENAINRAEMMNIQAAARRQLADMAFQEQMAYRNEVAKNTMLNGNGMRDGVAYMNGQPVGFRGAVPGIRLGIPEAGFTGDERAAYQRELMRRIASPQPRMVEAQVPVMELASPQTVRPLESVLPTTAGGLPDDTPEAASRGARMARGMGFPDIARAAMGGSTISERQSIKANTERGEAARGQLESFRAQIPSLTKTLSEELGVAVDEDVLASEILNAWSEGRKTPEQLRKMNPAALKRISEMAGQLGVDTKVLVRWAQDRKKK